jgi:hypothetical protein
MLDCLVQQVRGQGFRVEARSSGSATSGAAAVLRRC